MNYRALFSLRLKHWFYADNRCRDFQIEPTAHTLRLLKNYRCLLKPLPDGILVVTEAADNGAALIPFPENVALLFHLRLLNPDFPLFTELEEVTSKGAPLFMNARGNNPAIALALQLQERSASVSETLILPKGKRAASFRLGGNPLDNSPVAKFVLQGLPGGKVGKYDGGQKEISVNTSGAEPEDRIFTVVYPIKPRRQEGVFAEVEIHGNDSMFRPISKPPEFFIQFQAKEAKWRYYLVTNRKSDHPFVIEADRKFNVFAPDSADTLAHGLQLQYPGLPLVCFESTDSVRCQEFAVKQIRLKLGNDAIYENLPTPSMRNICAGQKDFVFFQVVKDLGVPVTQST
jgi:hypothetical protein